MMFRGILSGKQTDEEKEAPITWKDIIDSDFASELHCQIQLLDTVAEQIGEKSYMTLVERKELNDKKYVTMVSRGENRPSLLWDHLWSQCSRGMSEELERIPEQKGSSHSLVMRNFINPAFIFPLDICLRNDMKKKQFVFSKIKDVFEECLHRSENKDKIRGIYVPPGDDHQMKLCYLDGGITGYIQITRL